MNSTARTGSCSIVGILEAYPLTFRMPDHDLSYILNHLGEDRAEDHGAVVPPIVQSGNFAYPTVAKLREAFTHEHELPVYTRGANPTVAIARKKIAAL